MITKILDRDDNLFDEEMINQKNNIFDQYQNSNILVLGGAGSIGRAVVSQLSNYNPRKIHVVDISENNLAELIRSIRSSKIINFELKAFIIDITTDLFQIFIKNYSYDHVFNLAAMKHVRSEKDFFSLARMISTNIISPGQMMKVLSKDKVLKNFFSVSTDKASKPENVMGASKKGMEEALASQSKDNINLSFARFANIAFSDGSLLDGFKYRLQMKQPISIPKNIKRYFMTDNEGAKLCILAPLICDNLEIAIPAKNLLKPTSLINVAERFFNYYGYDLKYFEDEKEAILFMDKFDTNQWSCHIFDSDTTGEKELEEFYSDQDILIENRYKNIDIIKSKNSTKFDFNYDKFELDFSKIMMKSSSNKQDLVDLLSNYITEFSHQELNKSLDERM